MTKLVFGSSLGLVAALAALPCIAFAQPTAPTTTPPPTEPAPLPAPTEPAPVVTAPPPATEPTVPADAPTMVPVTPEPAPAVPVAVVLEAEPEEAPAPSPTITGHVEAAYHADFTDLGNRTPSPLMAYYTPGGHSFVLHAAHLAISHSFTDSISATIEVDAGYDASKNASYPFNTAPLFDVQEAYATYKPGAFSMTAGKFVTYQGIEVVEGPLNPTITRGYLFGLAEPVTHTGVKFHYTTDAVDLGIGLVNGWDALIDNNNMKTIIAKVGLTPSETFLVNLNGTFGSEVTDVADVEEGHRLSLDLTGAFVISESFSLWFQGNYGMDGLGGDDQVSWYGFGLQPTYTGETFTFGARAEFFADPDGARVALGDVSYLNFTVTPGFILAQGFKVRAELRLDIATEDVIGKPEEPGDMMVTAALGAEYVF
jgi:Putative beta-barrel porin-2, OmpL-like. bbp2